jgi:hypothetical protein
MIVNKIDSGYEFLTYTSDGGFLLRLTLSDTGAETLHTISLRVPLFIRPVKLRRGTIKKAIGDQHWRDFIRVKKRTFTSMLT